MTAHETVWLIAMTGLGEKESLTPVVITFML